MGKKSKEEILASLKLAETEEGRTGLVASFQAEKPEDTKTKDEKKKK